MTVAESLVMKRVFLQNILQKNFCTKLQDNHTKSSVADDTSQTDRRTDEVAEIVSIKDAFTLLPKRHLKRRFRSRNFQIISTYSKRYVQPQM